VSQHILIVDDEPAIADTLIFSLRNEGFLVTYARFAYEALDVIRQQSIDLVVLDVGLPDLNGFEDCA
jgi:two-component system, OmpR family, catabolic regulation response regulator CreB